MAGFIAEFFGYRAEDRSEAALRSRDGQLCPFLGDVCAKVLSRDGIPSGVCAIRQVSAGAPSVICCPNRLYAESYKILRDIAQRAFGGNWKLYAGPVAVEKAKQEGGAVAVWGHGWGGELHLPQRHGRGAYFVDWVLAKLDGEGELLELTAVEVQTIDTTGNYRKSRESLLHRHSIVSDTVGFNWENVSKRIIPQLIYKGQVLQREELCRVGLFFVCPLPIYNRILERLGGKEKLARFPNQPAAVHFLAYDYDETVALQDGNVVPLKVVEEHCTTVYKIQEAFSAVDLPDGNVYRDAIRRSLLNEIS